MTLKAASAGRRAPSPACSEAGGIGQHVWTLTPAARKRSSDAGVCAIVGDERRDRTGRHEPGGSTLRELAVVGEHDELPRRGDERAVGLRLAEVGSRHADLGVDAEGAREDLVDAELVEARDREVTEQAHLLAAQHPAEHDDRDVAVLREAIDHLRLLVSTVSPLTVPRKGSIASVVVPPRISTVELSDTSRAAACADAALLVGEGDLAQRPERLDVVADAGRAAVHALDETPLLQLVEVAAHSGGAHAEQPRHLVRPSRRRRRGCS